MDENRCLELIELQEAIRERIGFLETWVRFEIESHRESGGHHYLSVLQKLKSGEIVAKASARIWRTNAGIIRDFEQATGKKLLPGLSVIVLARVEYHPSFGLSLIIEDIDLSATLGQRELEKKETIQKLTGQGDMEKQKALSLPYLPSGIAVISSADAAGYGDFIKHLQTNARGFRFNYTLFPALMQGEKCPGTITDCLHEIQEEEGAYNAILILRGGGADSDLFGYDDYGLCKAIAECSIPVFTAIGHERDYHVADMVASSYFKTPTALADFLIEWVAEVEDKMLSAADSIKDALIWRLGEEEKVITSACANIRFALSTHLTLLDSKLMLLEANIKASDPRNILKQGYVLAADEDGKIMKNVHSGSAGDRFSLRFSDGMWRCRIEDVKEN